MGLPAQGQISFSDTVADALVAYLMMRYKQVSNRTLGRTILQKLCYFAKVSGVPLPFRFEIYHYGPFSQDIFDTTEHLLLDGVIEDNSGSRGQSNYVVGGNFDLLLSRFTRSIEPHRASLDRVAKMFSLLDPSQMELVSTIHYIHSSYREWFKETPTKETVVASVRELKGNKFGADFVGKVYEVLREAGLLS